MWEHRMEEKFRRKLKVKNVPTIKNYFKSLSG